MPTHIFFYFCPHISLFLSFFFFNDTATTEIYTLSLHDALPISSCPAYRAISLTSEIGMGRVYIRVTVGARRRRSEEHTSELQSLAYLVCRLLLEKKKKTKNSDELNKETEKLEVVTLKYFMMNTL